MVHYRSADTGGHRVFYREAGEPGRCLCGKVLWRCPSRPLDMYEAEKRSHAMSATVVATDQEASRTPRRRIGPRSDPMWDEDLDG